ncbi:hypothetical protein R6Q59_027605 [Mikania micrantha]|uniref:DNA replication checkpoint mediator MRC1 domain-containing protein n=1 Tax=Mikania micrantha TaxID=192012 RepID=A0A5N6NE83_9ASTR|nr:hypothetical protein E3N88_23370 [Mikania micrantha]
MESDDDYESFLFHNNEPSPKHRRLKRLKKSTVDVVQSVMVESVSELTELPKVDFASLEALDSSDIRAFDDSSARPSEGFDGDGDEQEDIKELRFDFDDTIVIGDRKETKISLGFEEGFDEDDNEKVKDLRSIYVRKETEEDSKFDNGFDDDETKQNLRSGDGDTPVKTYRKETKRGLIFEDDDINESGVDRVVKNEGEGTYLKIREEGEKESDEDAMNEKKKMKKRLKSSSDDSKAKTSYSSKRREEKERRAHLDQLHVESQRLLRETRGVSFKSGPLVQKPISSILERIRERKLEVSKKFSQSNINDFYREDDEHVIDHSKSVEKEVSDAPESAKEERISDALNKDPESDDVGMDGADVFGEQKGDVNTYSKKDLDVESKLALRSPIDDTQELFGDSQTSNDKESEYDKSSEEASSSQEEEMGPSLLTMKLKFDSAHDICDEEENDKENVDPHVQKHSSPNGDLVKAFVDDEAEEDDDSDDDQMMFVDEEVEDLDDIEELNKMIATGYKEKPIDLKARNELHQKWLKDKDVAVTDDLLRRLNVSFKLREASLHGEEGVEENVQMNENDNGTDDDDVDEEVKRPRAARINPKKTKEIIAQMFNDKDDFFSSDDEETKRLLVREHLFNKDKEKSKLVSPIKDKDSREVFGFIKKVNTVHEGRKKAKATTLFDTMLTGGNSNNSSKSSFLSRTSNQFAPISYKKGGSSGIRSFIFERDDSNNRSSISISEDMSDAIPSAEMQTKKVTIKYKRSQSQCRSSTQTTQVVSESSSSSFFELLRKSSVQSTGHNPDDNVELSQSAFAAFKILKKPRRI